MFYLKNVLSCISWAELHVKKWFPALPIEPELLEIFIQSVEKVWNLGKKWSPKHEEDWLPGESER